MSAKRCPRCGVTKDLEEFALRSSGRYRQSWCRGCTAGAADRWRTRKRVEAVGTQNLAHRRCVVCGAGFATMVTAQVACSESCREEFAGAYGRACREGARG